MVINETPQRQQLVPERTPLTMFAPAPPIVIFVIAPRQLATDGPLPLLLSGGGQASQRQLLPHAEQIPLTSLYEEAGGQEFIKDVLVGVRDVDRPLPYHKITGRSDRVNSRQIDYI